jgi:hypothetical protein
VSGGPAGEPALADVQAEFPGWRCAQGTNYLYYATHTATGTRVRGEDPLDLRDQIRGAEARLAWATPEPGPPGTAGRAGEE